MVISINADGTYAAAFSAEALTAAPVEWGAWSLEGSVFVWDTQHSDCPGVLDRPALYLARRVPHDDGGTGLAWDEVDDPCDFRAGVFAVAQWFRQ